jgi:hypothetical protein
VAHLAADEDELAARGLHQRRDLRIACIAPQTLVRITRSKSSRAGGSVAPPRDMTPAT